jgi:hypothetical protein
MLRVLRQYNADTAAVMKFAEISSAAELREGRGMIG